MRHLVPSEAIEIILPEPVAVSDLDTIGPALWQCGKEFVEVSNEISAMAFETAIVSVLYPNAPAIPQQLDSIGLTFKPGTRFSVRSTAPITLKAF